MLRRTNVHGPEATIAIAFIKHGHPWFAFCTVALKTCFRVCFLALLAWAGNTFVPANDDSGGARPSAGQLPGENQLPNPSISVAARRRIS